ncbi:MAG: hypothetical protein U0289_03935 [Cyclobacteriaceae bacterium]|jgi:hypothetical protein
MHEYRQVDQEVQTCIWLGENTEMFAAEAQRRGAAKDVKGYVIDKYNVDMQLFRMNPEGVKFL